MNSFYHQKTSVLTVRKLRRLQYWRLFRPTKIATIYTYSKKCNAADVRTEKCVNVSTWREVCIGGWAMKFNASRTAMQNVVQSVPATVPSLVWWYWHVYRLWLKLLQTCIFDVITLRDAPTLFVGLSLASCHVHVQRPLYPYVYTVYFACPARGISLQTDILILLVII